MEQGRRFGRLISPDARDRGYPVRALMAAAPTRTSRTWWANGAWLDQGMTGTCVGHGWAHWIEDGPVTWPGTVDPIEIYKEACLLDEWPLNDTGNLNHGTSVRAGAKAVVARGSATEYRWAWDAQTVVDAILEVGPVVLGCNWYRGMQDTDENGMLHITGMVDGGHCVEANHANTKKERVRIKNSWGRGWGMKGHAYLSFEDLDRLIREEGEACIAVER